MLRHVAVFRWKDGTTDEQVEMIERGLAALSARLPQLRAYAFGRDLGLREGNADFAIVADFDDEAAWQAYTEDAEHRRVIEELIAPVTEVRSAVQLRHP
ncbi:MAG TPA: Dabb family protein [Gaiellales bacterium]|nr:Dabb family protein [Gaiellales bacterium]